MRIRSDCRLCGRDNLETVLELAPTPPANEFVRAEDPPQEMLPLYLAQCPGCGHIQLPVVVDPGRLFSNYVYVSGTSPSFVEHFRQYAESECRRLQTGNLVVDVGSNDGTLLRHFQTNGMRVLGVDPAVEIARRASAEGVPTLPAFFGRALAQSIRKDRGPAMLVTANNVFAHADDLAEIALAARDLLHPSGRFVFEVQYLGDLLRGGLFDMIYHEHLSYHHAGPLAAFFKRLNMSLIDVERVPTHGGSIRCTVVPASNAQPREDVYTILDEERETITPAAFASLRDKVQNVCNRLYTFCQGAAQTGQIVAGYGAPAKMCTLTHMASLTAGDVAYVVDDSPWKQDLLCPGTRIPVVDSAHMRSHPPDAVVVFAWNFAEQIAAKLRAGGYTGKIVTPLPTLKEV